MTKKKRPNKPVQEKPAASPVTQGNVFATFLLEASSLGNEVEARRKFDNDVGVFLSEKNLVREFETWREARMKANVISGDH